MGEAVSLMTEIEGVESACIWEIGRDGRRLGLRAGLEDRVVGSDARLGGARLPRRRRARLAACT